MKTLKRIKKLKKQGLISEQEYNEIKHALENKGIQDLTKNDSYNVNNFDLPEQGKITNKEQKLIDKYKKKGFDFSELLLTLNQIEKIYKKK